MGPSQIRAIRARHGWTQAELAGFLGTDPVTVSRWERGVTVPRPSAVSRLARLTEQEESARLTELVGPSVAARLMRRALLLRRTPGPPGFAASPHKRMREVERARIEQLAFRARARVEP